MHKGREHPLFYDLSLIDEEEVNYFLQKQKEFVRQFYDMFH